ncbi:MAG: phosphatidylserine decarboxylase, partial [Rhodospirillales bacterium]|nr:phosphatidylserine decarboxylase [Rhodospirillales bacterium]
MLDSAITFLQAIRIHKAGWPFILLFAAAAVAAGFVSEPLGYVGAVLTAWCAYFFRDPDRVTPTRDGLIMSAADGVVQLIDQASPPEELGMGNGARWRVAVFMNVFDVHVNRIPADGTV